MAVSPVRFEHALIRSMLEWLLRVRDPEAESDVATGRLKLTYSRRFLWTTVLVALVANIAFATTLLVTMDDPPALAWGVGVFGMFWVAAMVAAWDALWTKVSVSEEGIHVDRRHGKPVFVPWHSIRRVRYSRLGSWWTFQAPGFPAVRVSAYRNGLRSFATIAERRMPDEPRNRASLRSMTEYR